MEYSFRLAARVPLYASFHRQDSTYLCYTSRGALPGTRNSSMGQRSYEIRSNIYFLWNCNKNWTKAIINIFNCNTKKAIKTKRQNNYKIYLLFSRFIKSTKLLLGLNWLWNSIKVFCSGEICSTTHNPHWYSLCSSFSRSFDSSSPYPLPFLLLLPLILFILLLFLLLLLLLFFFFFFYHFMSSSTPPRPSSSSSTITPHSY